MNEQTTVPGDTETPPRVEDFVATAVWSLGMLGAVVAAMLAGALVAAVWQGLQLPADLSLFGALVGVNLLFGFAWPSRYWPVRGIGLVLGAAMPASGAMGTAPGGDTEALPWIIAFAFAVIGLLLLHGAAFLGVWFRASLRHRYVTAPP